MANTTEMIIDFPGGKRVDAHYNGWDIPTDQIRLAGGDSSAPEPFTLFLASLGTCAGIYVLSFCQSRDIPTDNIKIIQRMITGKGGRLTGIDLDIRVPDDFPEKYYSALEKAASFCAVKKLMENPPEFNIKTVVEQ